jgi:hypothetical protein
VADTKISALAAKPAPAASDLLVLVDVSDTSMAASGTNKQATVSQLLSAGSVSVASKTANYTLTTSDSVVLGDVSGGAFSLTLPTAVSASGKRYTIKRADASANANALTVATTSSQTIDGSTTLTLDLDRHWITVISDGSNWQIVDLGPGVRTRFRQTADQTIANTITETTLFGTGVGSPTLPANFFTPGKSIRVSVQGDYSTLSASPGQYRVKIKLGSTILFDSTSLSLPTSATTWAVSFIVTLTCRSAGASGSVVVAGQVAIMNSSSGGVKYAPNTITQPVTVDTTGALAIDCTWTFSAASASNTTTSRDVTIESLN